MAAPALDARTAPRQGGEMPSTSQQTLLTAFNQASGSPAGGQSATTDQGLIDALGQATQVIDAGTQATAANTDALAENSQAKSSSSSGGGVSDVLSTASSVLGGGVSLMPLVSLFSSLVGRGQSHPAPPWRFFRAPSR